MKTHLETKLGLHKPVGAVSVALLMVLTGCGGEESPYGGEKTYGTAPQAQQDPPIGSSDDATVKPTPSPSSANGGAIVDDESDGDDPEDPVVTDPNTLVLHNFYQAMLDAESTLQLVDGEDPGPLAKAIAKAVKKRIVSDPADSILLQQKFGDGNNKSEGQQTIINKAGDANVEDGAPSQSGIQKYDRVTTGANCPSTFVCIERMQFVPESGTGSTYCYYNPTTGARAAFPYTPASNYSAADYSKDFGVYGPYLVKTYGQLGVDCSAPGGATLTSTETVRVTVAGGTLSSSPPMTIHRVNPLRPDFEVTVKNERVSENKRRPYLDETARLQRLTTVYLDTSARNIVKMIKSVATPIDLGILGGIINIDGVLVDLHLELCEDRLKSPVQRFCAN